MLRRTVELCVAAVLGVAVWSLAVLATAEYTTPVSGPGKMLRDFAVPVGAIVAALAFAFNRAHSQRTLRRDRERLMVDTAVGWLGKSLDLAEEILGRNHQEPLYYAAPSFQVDTIASLLTEAQAHRQDVSEPDLQRRLRVEISYAGAKLLTLLRARETSDFFDFSYYRAAHEAAGRSFRSEGAVSIAGYHNMSVDLTDSLPDDFEDLQLPEETRKNIGHLCHFVERVRSGGTTPFSHPFFGSSAPLDSMETILRFAVGKPDPDCELAAVLEGQEVADHWSLSGLFILLYQARYFRTRPDARVYNLRDESQVAQAIAAGAPSP